MTSFDVNNIAVLNVNGIDEIDFRYIVASSLELVKKNPCIYIYIYIYIYNIYTEKHLTELLLLESETVQQR